MIEQFKFDPNEVDDTESLIPGKESNLRYNTSQSPFDTDSKSTGIIRSLIFVFSAAFAIVGVVFVILRVKWTSDELDDIKNLLGRMSTLSNNRPSNKLNDTKRLLGRNSTFGTPTLSDSSAMLTLIVGPHKTGTCSVQSLLMRLRNSLAAEGILLCYKFEIMTDSKKEFSVRYNLPDFKSAANLAIDLQNGVLEKNADILHTCVTNRSFSQVIVAAEGLDYLHDHTTGMNFLKSAKPFVRAIITMRNITDWVLSWYHEIGINQSFSQWLQREKRSNFIGIGRINPYHVSKQYQESGIPVIEIKFMDMDFLFCSAIVSSSICKKLRNHSVTIPHFNNKEIRHKNESECAPKKIIDELKFVLSANYNVPIGLNWSKLICD